MEPSLIPGTFASSFDVPQGGIGRIALLLMCVTGCLETVKIGWHGGSVQGVIGELRFDGRRAGPASMCPDVTDNGRSWHSPDKRVAMGAWGGTGMDCRLATDCNVATIADCTLYDRDRLCAELGLPPTSDEGDASLLTKAYLRWGEAMLERLDGDFAFVVCDLGAGRAFAATDPMGMRPLFYRHEPGRSFAFSTSAHELAAWTGLDPRIPESRLLDPLLNAEELAHFKPEIPRIDRLLAAHACHVGADSLRVGRYWSPTGRRPSLSENDTEGWIEGLRERMRRAVSKRVADGARVGVMFSGGLDSSALLALSCEMASVERVSAYSLLDRGDPSYPETLAIDRMIAATGATSIQCDVANLEEHGDTARAVLARVPRFDYILNGFVPYFNAMAAKSGVNVMMYGLDADALFSHGDLLLKRLRRGRYHHVLREARKADRLLGVPWLVPQVPKMQATVILSAVLPFPARRALRSMYEWMEQPAILREALVGDDAISRLQLRGRLREQSRLLRSFPRQVGGLPASSMDRPVALDGVGRVEARTRHYGLEMRCPFMDRDLIEFAAWIPLELRLRNGRPKWILRKAMNPYLPHAVAWRGDKVHPGSHFSRVVLRPVLDQIVRDYRGSGPAIAPYADRDRFLEAADQWRAGAIEAVWKLAPLVALEHWLQHNRDLVHWGA